MKKIIDFRTLDNVGYAYIGGYNYYTIDWGVVDEVTNESWVVSIREHKDIIADSIENYQS